MSSLQQKQQQNAAAEDKLRAALRLQAPADLATQILQQQRQALDLEKPHADDLKLRSALQIQAPPQLAERIISAIRRRSRRYQQGFALAASILLGFGVTLFFYQPTSPHLEALHHASLKHMQLETTALSVQHQIEIAQVDQLMQEAGRGHISYLPELATHASICPMLHHNGVHLVFRQDDGDALTAFVMPNEFIDETSRHFEDGYHIRIDPTPTGSLAVLGQNLEDVDAIQQELQDALRWQSQTAWIKR